LGGASAALDRLLHRATVINIRGESYRLKEKRQAQGSAGSAAPNLLPKAAKATLRHEHHGTDQPP
jgi:hypothetical protein